MFDWRVCGVMFVNVLCVWLVCLRVRYFVSFIAVGVCILCVRCVCVWCSPNISQGVVGTGWSWLRIGTGGGHLWVR